ncbi:GNAT family N-acetyltransferase [Sediminibacillus massiliensis]|uniref:GNAT family N-acetyltransferase n=1 Tax=Sediminibacillus massiliensis TaxID=1926277 RepID=UPI0015C38847|nr:GNAT family N-acetyltransferase [Sediminibacillus massiliensis]
MIEELRHWDREIARSILKVQIPAYKVEARLIGHDIPALHDTVESIISSEETYIGYYFNKELAGVLSYDITENVLDICRLVVAPPYFRKGIANDLIDHLLNTRAKGKVVRVTTGKRNTPAVNLYKKLGFCEKDEVKTSEGFMLTKMEKKHTF